MNVSAPAGAAGPEDRRAFFTRLFWGLAALLGALVGIPVLGAFLSPAFRRQERAQWIAIGPAGAFTGTPGLAHHVHPSREGWVNVSAEMQVWVAKTPDGTFRIFDNHCTHLGCPYHWEATEQRFVCPCHNGVFDATGKVLGGPPPRPLDYYDSKVEAGTLFMGAFHRGGT
ncbi:MAG TPA: Rieske 2Fe-2S domain-containing protein [bacterium]|nr:Rieske 2Fe-2S domain-containing protein [bacterium]